LNNASFGPAKMMPEKISIINNLIMINPPSKAGEWLVEHLFD